MSKKTLTFLTAAAAASLAMSAQAQIVQPTPGEPGEYALPDGSAKKLIQDNCTICHNRATS